VTVVSTEEFTSDYTDFVFQVKEQQDFGLEENPIGTALLCRSRQLGKLMIMI